MRSKVVLGLLLVLLAVGTLQVVVGQVTDNPPPTPTTSFGMPGLYERVDRNFDAIGRLPAAVVDRLRQEPPARPTNPVSKRWVAVYTHRTRTPDFGDGRPQIPLAEGTAFFVLNPGHQVANVNCLFLAVDGSGLVQQQVRALNPGSVQVCGLQPAPGSSLDAWAMVVSDQWVLVDGGDLQQHLGPGIGTQRDSMIKFYPIDCSDRRGIEYLCSWGTYN